MRKAVLSLILIVLAMVLFSSVAFAYGQEQNLTIPQRYVWKVYVENSFPFGMLERNIKTRVTLKVIHTDEVELGQGFVTVVLRAGREPVRLLIPNDRVIYIIQTNWFHGWDTYGGTE